MNVLRTGKETPVEYKHYVAVIFTNLNFMAIIVPTIFHFIQ
jgi:hypothetical protein